MKSKFFKPMLMDEQGDGGGAGAGTGSLLTTPPAGSGSQVPAGSGNNSAAAGAQTPPGNASGTNAAQGNAHTDWRSSLPEEIRDHASLKNIQDPVALAKSYVNAQKLIGAEKISIPGKHATEDDWKQVYTKLGLPETADKYEVKFKDTVTLDQNFATEFKDVAFKSGILPKQAQALADWFSQANEQSEAKFAEQIKVQTEKNINALKEEWGVAFDNKLRTAQKVVAKFGDEKINAFIENSGLGNNPDFIKFVAKIGETFKEDSEVNPGSNGIPAMTPKDAIAAANKIIGDTSHPYHQKGHINHQAAIKEVQDLFKMAYPQK